MIVATWQKCVYSLKNELPSQQFNTWIRPLKAVGGGNRLLLLAPNKFVQDWVRENFLNRIQEIVLSHFDIDSELEVVLEIAGQKQASQGEQHGGEREERERLETLSTSDLISPADNPGTLSPDAHSGQADQRQQFSRELSEPGDFRERPKAQDSHHASNKLVPAANRRSNDNHLRYRGELNASYTFANFIEGKSNQLARAAAAQVANNAGGAYNPLFIYGGVGLGKTHLMHAIGNYMREQNPDAKVVYLHSQTFVHSMVSALQLNAINEFKRYYHSVDALLIDDIQFFANKERSQEEFFHTFNAIFEGGRQIILTCDKYYNQINGLEERLKSRFGWGLSVAVEPPELETRAAILINKANRENVYLPNEAAIFMAQKLRSNVRELEGALKKVIAHSRFVGEDISVPLIKEALKDLLAIQNKLVTVDNIQRTVAEYYKIKMGDMISKRRSRSVARPRQVAMCLSKELTNHSLPEIGTMYGGRDHTTVLHACKTIKELRKSSTDINEDYQNLLRSLSS